MASQNRVSDAEDRHKVVADARREQAVREKGYRARAIEMYPWVCGHCARDFTDGKKLRELEVHHKNHNHDDNPPDGSNWELLCMYCHENQHNRNETAKASSGGLAEEIQELSTHQPFSGLAALLNKNK